MSYSQYEYRSQKLKVLGFRIEGRGLRAWKVCFRILGGEGHHSRFHFRLLTTPRGRLLPQMRENLLKKVRSNPVIETTCTQLVALGDETPRDDFLIHQDRVRCIAVRCRSHRQPPGHWRLVFHQGQPRRRGSRRHRRASNRRNPEPQAQISL